MAATLDRLKAALAGRYLVDREVGAGGMATVFLADDVKHNRKVAIKVLKEDVAATVGAARFLREIQIAHAPSQNYLPLATNTGLMETRMKQRWWMVLIFSSAACGQAPEFTKVQRAAVGDTIRAEADRVIAALASRQVDSLADLFTRDADFVYVDNGRIYPDNAALKAAATPFFGRIGRAGGRWDPAHVLVLAPDAGAFTGVFRAQMTDTAGTPLWTDGKIWTFVYQRREGRWQIVQAHEVNAKP